LIFLDLAGLCHIAPRQQSETHMDQRQPTYEELLDLVEELRAKVAALELELAEAKQAAARQAAPFRRRENRKKPEGEKKTPGQKKGHPGHYRQPPPEIDQMIEVPLERCPTCQGELTDVHRVEQFLEELPEVLPRRYKIITHAGVCPRHGLVRSTHPLQASTAVGAAGTHLGPRAQSVAVALSHQSGISMRNVCQILKHCFSLSLTPGGLSHLLRRAASRTVNWYDQIVTQIRSSAAVFADETSWYVGEVGWWLWDFTTDQATLYVVADSRGSAVVHEVLGNDFQGILVTDCLASYNPIQCRKHKCIAHHLRVLKEYEEDLEKRNAKSLYLTLWKTQLQDVVATWKARDSLPPAAWSAKVQQLKLGVENLLDHPAAEPEEARFRERLRRQRAHLLGCLDDPAAEPTNNRAERDLRPAVIARKISCGNRTVSGKITWERLRSIVVTAQKQGLDLIPALASRLALQAAA
jgi:hypothetical protein